MARPFNLTAQLNVQGPAGIRPVIQKLRKELSGIKADLKVDISPQAAKNAGRLNQQVKGLEKTLSSAAGHAAKLSASINSTAATMSKLQGVTSKTSKGLAGVGAASKDTGQQLGIARTEMEEFGRVSGLALRRFAGFTVASTAVFGFIRAVSEGVSKAISFEREIIKIAQVTGKTVSELQGLSGEITRLSTGFGVASSDLVEVSRVLSQAGLSADDTKKALESLAKSTLAPTFTDIRNTTEGVIAAMRQFGIQAGQLEGVLGSINAVAGSFAVEADDIVAAIRRVGGVFKAASGDIAAPTTQLNELVAIFTSVRATTRESAESIATGLRTIFTRIQRPRTIEFLRQFNIELQNSQGQFIGAFNAMQKLSEGLKDLDPRDVRFSQVVEEIGGFRQVGKLIPAIQQFATTQDALGVATAGAGSLAGDAATAQQALAVQIIKVREEFEALIRSLAGGDTFKTIAGGALQLASSMIKVVDAIKPVLPFLAILGAVKGVGLARQFGGGFFGGIRAGGGAGGVGAGLAGAATGQRGAASVASNQALVTALNGLLATQKINTGALSANTAALNRLAGAVRTSGVGRRGFAGGGIVPGAGNRDTVPAMLTPGEFVIRKSSVQKYGAGALAGINNPIRRGNGSTAPENTLFGTKAKRTRAGATIQSGASKAKTKITAGAAFLQPIGIDKDIRGSVKLDEVIANAERARGEKFSFGSGTKKALKKGLGGFGSGEGNNFLSFDIVSASLPQKIAELFETELETAISDMSLRFAKEEMGSLRSGFDVPKMRASLKNFNFEQVSGNVFEAMVSASLDPFGSVSKSRSNAPFDFPTGLGQVANKFGEKRLSGIPTDTKRTFNIDAIESIIGKIKTIALEFATGQLLSGGSQNAELAALGSFDDKKAGIKGGKKFFASGANPIIRKAAGGRIPRKGTDSIPALLTPGEFVMSRDATKNIGTGTLRALNKGTFRGFANGGVVQRFAGGSDGPVQQRFNFSDPSGDTVAANRRLIVSTNGVIAANVLNERTTKAGTVATVADTKADQLGTKSEAVNQRSALDAIRRFVQAVVQAAQRINAARAGAGVAERGLIVGGGAPPLKGGFFSKFKDKFKGIGSTNALLAASFLPSVLPSEGTAGAVSTGATQGLFGGLTASALGLGPVGAVAVGLGLGLKSLADGLQQARIAEAAQNLSKQFQNVADRFKDFKQDGIGFKELEGELGETLRAARLDTLAEAGTSIANFLGGRQGIAGLQKTILEEGAEARGLSAFKPGTVAFNPETPEGRLKFATQAFNLNELNKGLGSGVSAQREAEINKEFRDATAAVRAGRLQEGAQKIARAESKTLAPVTQVRSEQLQAGISEGLLDTIPRTVEDVKALSRTVVQFNKGGQLTDVTSTLSEDINQIQAGFLGLGETSARFREKELILIDALKRNFDAAATLDETDPKGARSLRVAAQNQFVKERNKALLEESSRISQSLIAQESLSNASKLATEKVNLLAETLTTMSQVMKVVQGNFSESIRLERSRLKAFEGNFQISAEKNPFSKILENPRAFTQGQIDTNLDDLAKIVGGKTVGPGQQGAIGFGMASVQQSINALNKDALRLFAEGDAERDRNRGGVMFKGVRLGESEFDRSPFLNPKGFEENKFDREAILQLEKQGDLVQVIRGLEGKLNAPLSQLFKGAAQFTAISRDLPKVLADELAKESATGGTPVETRLADALRQGREGFVSQELADSIAANLRIEKEKRQKTGGTKGLLESGKIAEIISPIFENQLKVSTEVAKILEGGIQEFVKATNDRINLEKKVIALSLKRQQSQAKFDQLRANLTGGKFDSGARGVEDFRAQIARLTGGGIGTRGPNTGFGLSATQDPREILRRFQVNREQASKQQNVLARAGLGDTEAAKAASDELKRLGVESNNLIASLKLLSDSSAQIAKIESDRAKIEQSAQGFEGLIRGVLTGQTDQAESILRGALAASQGAGLAEGSVEQNKDIFAFLDALKTVGSDAADPARIAALTGIADIVREIAALGKGNLDSTAISGLLLATGNAEQAFGGLNTELTKIQTQSAAAQTALGNLLTTQDQQLRNIATSIQKNLITPLQTAVNSIAEGGKIGAGNDLRNTPGINQSRVEPTASLPKGVQNALQAFGRILGGGGGENPLDKLTTNVDKAATTINSAMTRFTEGVEKIGQQEINLKISPDSAVQLVGEGAFGTVLAEALVPVVTRIVTKKIIEATGPRPGAAGDEIQPIGGGR